MGGISTKERNIKDMYSLQRSKRMSGLEEDNKREKAFEEEEERSYENPNPQPRPPPSQQLYLDQDIGLALVT